jgi:replication factor C small subunit
MKKETDIWSFVHEPTDFDSMVLNPEIKPTLKKALTEIPNLLIYGPPGVGKGTFAHILLRESGLDSMWVNASDETGIDNMRSKIKQFSTALGITDLKVVVLNEADSLSSGQQGAQKILRQMMEDVQNITRFILLANYESYIIPEIKSRCQTIKMDNPPGKDIFKFCEYILKSEGVSYTTKILLNIVKKCYPDIRKTVWTLQENTVNKKLSSSRISSSEDTWKLIFNGMLKGDVDTVRKALKSNYIDYNELYKYLFDNIGEFKSPGDAIIDIGEYLYRDGTVAIKEINFMAMFVKMMKEGVV